VANLRALETSLASRMNILPDPDFLDLKPALAERLERIASSIHAEQFASLLNPVMRQALERGFAAAGAHEGTVWLTDETGEHLVPAFNTGPNADELVGRFKQPLNAGLICMVLASEQPFLENEVWKNSGQSKLLDSLLKAQTCAMIAVPFSFLRASRGVISCVQLKRAGSREPDPPGFRPEHLGNVELAAELVSQLTDLQVLSRAVGWANE
jgi:hypothetical protein